MRHCRIAPLVCAAVVFMQASASAQQTSSTLTLGAISAQLKRVNVISGGASADAIYGTYAPGDSRLFVVQKTGAIRYIDPNVVGGTVNTLVDLNTALPGFLETNSEKGLLGMAFHPDFNNPNSPGFHKFYTYTSEDETKLGAADFLFPESATTPVDNYAVLREWTANAGITSATPSRVVMKIADPQPQHNSGTITFSPIDHYLYWAIGDGGGNSSSPDSLGGLNNPSDGHANSPDGILPHGNAQDRSVILGKMLRINPLPASASPSPQDLASANGQYQIPKNNPFTQQSNINPATSQPYPNWNPNWLGEIYAYGLRNPYRWSFDRGDPNNPNDPNRGKIYVGDVGLLKREEVDVIQPGGNYGWVIREGTLQPPFQPAANPQIPNYTAPVNAITGLPDTLIDPIAEYDHTVGVSIIGGFVYRGTKLPALEGMYVFGEYQSQIAGVNAGNGILMYFDPNGPAPRTIFRLGITSTGNDALPAADLQGFAEGVNGEIYALFDNGSVMELVPEPSALICAALGVPGIVISARFRRRKSNERLDRLN
jgi:glucose/arabinose dehydrogenase